MDKLKTILKKPELTKKIKDDTSTLFNRLFEIAAFVVMFLLIFQKWLTEVANIPIWLIQVLVGALILWLSKAIFNKILYTWARFSSANRQDHEIITEHMDTIAEYVMKTDSKADTNTETLQLMNNYIRQEKHATGVLSICREAFDATVDFHAVAISSLPYNARQYINLTNDSFRKFVLQIVEEDFYHFNEKGQRIDNFNYETFKNRVAANSIDSAMNAEKMLGSKAGALYVKTQKPYFEKYMQDVKGIIEGNPNNKSKKFFKLSLQFMTQGISNIIIIVQTCYVDQRSETSKQHEEIFNPKLDPSPVAKD